VATETPTALATSARVARLLTSTPSCSKSFGHSIASIAEEREEMPSGVHPS